MRIYLAPPPDPIPTFLQMLGVMFSAVPEKSLSALAGVFIIELLMQRDYYLLARDEPGCLLQVPHDQQINQVSQI